MEIYLVVRKITYDYRYTSSCFGERLPKANLMVLAINRFWILQFLIAMVLCRSLLRYSNIR